MVRVKRSLLQHEKILESARVLFWDRGYEKTTMRDIARACGFEPGNLYNYFRSKEQVLYEVMKLEMQRILSPIRDLDEKWTPVEKLRAMVKANLDINLTGPKKSGVFDYELKNLSSAHRHSIIALRDTYDRIMYQIIREGIDQGYFAETDEKVVAYLISSMVVRTRMWFSSKGRLSSDEVIDIVFGFILSGLKNHKKAD